MAGASGDEAREFAHAFRGFLAWVHSEEGGQHHEVVDLVRDWLGSEGVEHSVVTRDLPVFEHVNLQTALNEWMTQPGRTVDVHGISLPPHFGSIGLQQLVTAGSLPPIRLSAPPLVDLPDGPASTLACFVRAVLTVRDDAGVYVVLVSGPSEHEPRLALEIAGLPVASAQRVLAELDELRHTVNVYRGHLLDVVANDMGGISLNFAAPQRISRDDVILPEPTLARIERHALGIPAHREALLEVGQHLKRGLLLYGPPGTGKTYTTRYVMGRLDGYTRLVLTGRTLHAIGAVAELARSLTPAAVVLEDVDLVAEDRSFGPGSSPVLFDLLDAMDGAAADADLLFLLTTNRADLLEPALAARPGRVDVAVGIDVPDAPARRALFGLYARGVPVSISDGDLDAVVARTEGVTASFLKELLRRAVLESLDDESPLAAVTAEHVSRALDDLLDGAQSVTRSLLGVGGDADGPRGDDDSSGPGGSSGVPMSASGPGPRSAPAFGWTAYGPLHGRPRYRRFRG